ncbi:MAG: PAS domain S-box protein, partial [Deltaproteobacteria bacterium]|nr:PAS domain S-box protein [Deltaproteobacteria bacterium]
MKKSDQTNLELNHEDYQELEYKFNAISKVQAVIEFDLEGNVLTANENFLNALDYTLGEVKGQHHALFVDTTYRKSDEYKAFWKKLGRGEFDSGEYKRVGKGGKEVWPQASYNPIFDADGKPYKVVKYATDITEQKIQNSEYTGQLQAIRKAQAVIELNMDGTVIEANDNFLTTLGYTLEEIKGKHHSMFVDDQYRESAAYAAFWEKLRRGEFVSGEFKRMAKGGKDVWIQASYNPIFDLSGKVIKVVKFATDITAQKLQNADYSGQIAAISKAQAVIEFNMDGTIIQANQNFLDTLGYSLKEIEGKHHSLFVESGYANSIDYKEFWEKLSRGEFTAAEFKRVGKNG